MTNRGSLHGPGRWFALPMLALFTLVSPALGADTAEHDGNWSVVNTSARTLTVYAADGRRLARYADIALGSGGVAAVHYHDDRTTPRGSYRIIRIRPSRRFDTFYQLDYPTAEHAQQAIQSGRLTAANGDTIMAAARAGHLPPQTTILGGGIGIHGVGSGSLAIHTAFNWTNGCVALTNEQLHQFGRFAVVGMRVVID